MVLKGLESVTKVTEIWPKCSSTLFSELNGRVSLLLYPKVDTVKSSIVEKILIFDVNFGFLRKLNICNDRDC